jgi:hypothetical protein
MTASASLPIELVAALDIVAFATIGANGRPSGTVTGPSELRRSFERYSPVAVDGRLIALSSTIPELRVLASATGADEIVVLCAGPFERLLRPIRARAVRGRTIEPNLAANDWRVYGYQARQRWAVLGPGSLGWAMFERLFRRFGNPAVADRCRVAMLRSLVVSRRSRLGVILVQTYVKAR